MIILDPYVKIHVFAHIQSTTFPPDNNRIASQTMVIFLPGERVVVVVTRLAGTMCVTLCVSDLRRPAANLLSSTGYWSFYCHFSPPRLLQNHLTRGLIDCPAVRNQFWQVEMCSDPRTKFMDIRTSLTRARCLTLRPWKSWWTGARSSYRGRTSYRNGPLSKLRLVVKTPTVFFFFDLKYGSVFVVWGSR